MYLKLIFLMLSIYLLKVSSNDSISLTKCPSTNLCGDNAKCFDEKNGREYENYKGPYCRCNTEYYGYPPNCTRVCENDCKAGQYCNLGEKTCKTGCRSHDDCPKNQICNEDNICVKGCVSNSGCELNQTCDEDFRKCSRNCENDSPYPIPIFGVAIAYNPCGENGVCSAKDHREYCTCADNYFPEKGKGCRKIKDSDIIPQTVDCTEFCGENALCKIIEKKINCYCRPYSYGNPLKRCAFREFLPPPPTALKPGQESEISVACIATLCAG